MASLCTYAHIWKHTCAKNGEEHGDLFELLVSVILVCGCLVNCFGIRQEKHSSYKCVEEQSCSPHGGQEGVRSYVLRDKVYLSEALS